MMIELPVGVAARGVGTGRSVVSGRLVGLLEGSRMGGKDVADATMPVTVEEGTGEYRGAGVIVRGLFVEDGADTTDVMVDAVGEADWQPSRKPIKMIEQNRAKFSFMIPPSCTYFEMIH